MIFAFDIETTMNPEMVDMLPKPETKLGNLVDEDKINAKKDKARDQQIERMGLDAATARMICFSCVNDDGEHSSIISEMTDDEEIRVISEALDLLARPDSRVVTFNGKNFDLPFLFKRAAILRIPNPAAPLSAWTKKFDESRHCDVSKVWTLYNNAEFVSLEFFASTVLRKHKLEADFRKFIEMLQAEAGREEIEAYCRQDSRLAWEGYKLLQGHLF